MGDIAVVHNEASEGMELLEADLTMDEDGFQEVCSRRSMRKRNRAIKEQEKESSDEGEEGDRNSKKVRNKNGVAGPPSSVSVPGTRNHEDQPRGSSGEASTAESTSPSNRKRLLFPNDLTLSFHEKLLWAVKLGRARIHTYGSWAGLTEALSRC